MTHSPAVIHQIQEPKNLFFEDLISRSLQKWYWFLVALVISTSLGYLFILYKQPVYQINAKLLIKDQQSGVEEINSFKESQPVSPKKNIENEIEVLHSSFLMKRVVEKLNLPIHYYEVNSLVNREVYEGIPFTIKVIKATPLIYDKAIEISLTATNTVRIDSLEYPIQQEIQTNIGTLLISANQSNSTKNRPLKVRFVPIEQQVLELLQKLKIEHIGKNSSVIQLTIEDVIPSRGEAILTQLLKEYKQAALLNRNELMASSLNFIDLRVQGLSADVARLEQQVESYKTTHNITDLSNQADYTLKTMQDNDAQINQVAIQLANLDDLEKYIKNQTGKQGIAPAIFGLQDKVLLGLIERLGQLERERADLEKLTSDQNFLVQNLVSQIKSTRLNIQENIQTMRVMLSSSKQQLVSRNNLLETKIRNIPQQERTLIDITRQQAIKNELYTYLLKKREETTVALGATLSDNLIIDLPQSTLTPTKPVKPLVFGFFILIGFVCPVLVIAGQKILNKRIHQRRDVEEQTIVPILGELVRYPSTKSLVITHTENSIISEQIRSLRANLQLMQSQTSESLVLLTTSSISGEGKTFLSQNLGASLALANFPTVLVEMDLRNPRLHQALGLSNKKGISDYLKGECELDEILQPIPGYDQFFLVPSGLAGSSAAELLCTPRLGQLLNLLKQRFAFVLIDTPPVGIISDAQLLAPFADITLFVVRHDITPKNCIKIINCLNEEKRFPKPLIVLNAVPEDALYHLNYSYKYTHYSS
ncbi:GumC family protein [Spirosoma aerophilum]